VWGLVVFSFLGVVGTCCACVGAGSKLNHGFYLALSIPALLLRCDRRAALGTCPPRVCAWLIVWLAVGQSACMCAVSSHTCAACVCVCVHVRVRVHVCASVAELGLMLSLHTLTQCKIVGGEDVEITQSVRDEVVAFAHSLLALFSLWSLFKFGFRVRGCCCSAVAAPFAHLCTHVTLCALHCPRLRICLWHIIAPCGCH
jgi:hypothetical protein